MTENRLHILRRITQVLFIVLIVLAPVLDIFRFDVDTRTLIVFGNEWDLGLQEGFYANQSLENATHVARQFFLKAILPWLLILAIFPLLGVFSGRFFCGWFCPEGALFELFDFLTIKIFGRRGLFTKKANDPDGCSRNRVPYVIAALLLMVVIPLFFGVALTGYFVNPRTVWQQVINWEFTFGVKAGIIGISIYMLLSMLIVRHTLCKYVCSAGLMQMMFGWVSPVALRIKVKESNLAACTDCKKCEKACFMDVKPRALISRKNINCVNCGECIEACKKELGTEKGVFGYSCRRNNNLPATKIEDKINGTLLQIHR